MSNYRTNRKQLSKNSNTTVESTYQQDARIKAEAHAGKLLQCVQEADATAFVVQLGRGSHLATQAFATLLMNEDLISRGQERWLKDQLAVKASETLQDWAMASFSDNAIPELIVLASAGVVLNDYSTDDGLEKYMYIESAGDIPTASERLAKAFDNFATAKTTIRHGNAKKAAWTCIKGDLNLLGIAHYAILTSFDIALLSHDYSFEQVVALKVSLGEYNYANDKSSTRRSKDLDLADNATVKVNVDGASTIMSYVDWCKYCDVDGGRLSNKLFIRRGRFDNRTITLLQSFEDNTIEVYAVDGVTYAKSDDRMSPELKALTSNPEMMAQFAQFMKMQQAQADNEAR